jgi:GNAT superfamily N-acetyltransferase
MDRANQFAIRKAAQADVAGILDCLALAFAPYRGDYTPDGFLDTVLTSETIHRRLTEMAVFVATNSGQVVGTIGCQALLNGEGHLRGMAVRPEWQASGVAAQLLEAAEEELRRAGCKRVTLDTTEPLKRAVRFYEKHGYSATGKVGDFFGMKLFEYAKSL